MPKMFPSRRFPLRRLALLGLVACAWAVPAHAERADRGKPMEVLADKSGSADLQNQVSRFSGNVVITQGTMVIKADRVEIRQSADGFRSATAWGAAGVPVTYRQKRDGVDEFVEGAADRVEFDGRAEVLRFIGNGVVRRLRGSETVDEITGSMITWNHGSELFSVQGGQPSAVNPDGRVRAVLGPGTVGGAKDAASAPGQPTGRR